MIRILIQMAALSLLLLAMACATGTKPVETKPGKTKPTGAAESGDPQKTYQRGLAYLEQGETEKALSLFMELTASGPAQAEVYNAIGVVYRRKGLLDKAVEAYTNALKLKDRYVEVHYNLGIVYREKGEFRKAEVEYQQAIALDPNFAQAHHNLAVLYDLYLNRPGDALKHYKEYKRLTGGNETLDVWIADLERRLEGSAAQGVVESKGGAN
jgi:tetratricopeptide (TPR) repeat protein